MRRHVLMLVSVVCVLAAASAAEAGLTDPTGGGAPHYNQSPSLGLHYLISTVGTFPSPSSASPGAAGSDPYLGEIGLFAGYYTPRNWELCDGQLLQISQNTALFSLLGTTYGGDGQTTFGLPDLRGRAAIHAGTGPGLSNRRLGQKGGAEQVTLTQAQMPSHNHTLSLGGATGNTGGSQPHENMQPYQVVNYVIALHGLFPSPSGGPVAAGADPFIGEIGMFGGTFAPRNWALCNGQLLSISQNTALFSILGTTYGGDGQTTFGLPDLRGRAAVHEGTGPGLSNRPLGQKGGVEQVTLTASQMPAHAHWVPLGWPTGNAGGGQAHENMQPYGVVNYIIALSGLYPSPDASSGPQTLETPVLGEVKMFGGSFAPRDWAFCDGQLLPISQNTALFSILGTTYGGDGQTTFGLPDLRGRSPVGTGQGPGLSDWTLGERGGQETVALSLTELPSHVHTTPYGIDVTDIGGTWTITREQNPADDTLEVDKRAIDMDPFDMEITVTGGQDPIQVIENVLNDAGIAWQDYHFQLGSGLGGNFTPSEPGDGLGFLLSSSAALPVLALSEDELAFSGGTVPPGGLADFLLRIDMPGDSPFVFTLRQWPTTIESIPEPATAVLAVALAALAGWTSRRRRTK